MASLQQYFAGEVALWYQLKCGNPLHFLGCHNLTGVSIPKGERTPQYCRVGKSKFEADRALRSAPGMGAATLVAPDTVLNVVQELGCAVNLYVMHATSGADENPTNYDYLYMYNGFELTSEDFETHVVGIDPEGNQRILVSMPGQFLKRLKVKQLDGVSLDMSSYNTNDFNAVFFCDDPSCNEFGELVTIGCQTGYVVTNGTTAEILKTTDGGSTWSEITSPFTDTDEHIGDVVCQDSWVVVTNQQGTAYAYSTNGGTSWTEVTSPTSVINAVESWGGTQLWFVGQGGYIGYSNNRGSSVSTQTSPTSQSLNDISAKDDLTLYAVGDSNSFIRTTDGGSIWEAVTGPAGSVYPNDLYVVEAVEGTDVVFVGDESGNVYRSTDNGDNWTTVLSDSSMVGGIYGIAAPACNVIAVIGNDQDPYFYSGATVDGVFFQSVDGGSSFNQVTIPSNNGLLSLHACDVNQYWVTGVDGTLLKVSGPTISAD